MTPLKALGAILLFFFLNSDGFAATYYEVTDTGNHYGWFADYEARVKYLDKHMAFLEEGTRSYFLENEPNALYTPAKGDVGKLVLREPDGRRAIINVAGFLVAMGVDGLKQVSEDRYESFNDKVNSMKVNQFGFHLGSTNLAEAERELKAESANITARGNYKGGYRVTGLLSEGYSRLPVVNGKAPHDLSLWFYEDKLSQIQMCWYADSYKVWDVRRFNKSVIKSIKESIEVRYGARDFEQVEYVRDSHSLQTRFLTPSKSAFMKFIYSDKTESGYPIALCLSYVESDLYQRLQAEKARLDAVAEEKASAGRREEQRAQASQF
ncbi:hypothetical protein A6779_18840 [Marinobacter adhaerens]|uniref:hypothetical protein n=1 Tax=Marinobacter adhaerens TaxID=1033846 RepID=UPI000840F3E3|nr:hypothetical protein [Marinobacter adhaerens]ODM30906.1 hypothetical protein A6779_18840 [Marinobacter adhaerens]